MKSFHDTAFAQSLRIQVRVIGALLMREVITRYGRKNIGFLWLFVEPLLFTLFITLAWQAFRADKFSTLNIMAFMLTGYPMVMMWRNTANRAIGALSANTNLLYHRNVRPIDTVISRMLLEIAGASIAQILIILGFSLVGWIDFPYDPLYMLLAWLMMAFFGMGLGFITCFMAFRFESFDKLWHIVSFLLLPISGAFFLVSSLPPAAQEFMLYLPMIHGTEMFRHGYFGNSIITMENPFYLFCCTLIILLIGLAMMRSFSKGVMLR